MSVATLLVSAELVAGDGAEDVGCAVIAMGAILGSIIRIISVSPIFGGSFNVSPLITGSVVRTMV
jgi:hypothetical protein